MNERIRRNTQKLARRACAASVAMICLFGTSAARSENLAFSYSSLPYAQKAEDGFNATIVVASANIRNNPGTVNTTVTWVLYNGERVTAKDIVTLDSDPSGSKIWCHIEFKDAAGGVHEGYIVDSFLVKDDTIVEDTAFEEEIAEFPESYKIYLRDLHRIHPNWHFRPAFVGRDFQEAVDRESRLGVSLIENYVNDAWKSIAEGAYDWETGEYVVYDGKLWVNASQEVIKHYLDPRNGLSEQNIFQFLELGYHADYQKEEYVQELLKGSFMEWGTIENPGYDDDQLMSYAEIFMLAARQSNANPVFLAAKVLQEVSAQGSGSTSGDYYSDYFKRQYTNLYNFYNIGASSSPDPIALGLALARDGRDSDFNSKYDLPWNNQVKAIVGGSKFIANAYINIGQNTTYFMKFNVTPSDPSQFGNHQYMTNIEGAYGEGRKMYKAYSRAGILGQDLLFTIPVYDNMPSKPCAMPAENGNPNAYLKSLNVDGNALTPEFDPIDCQEYSLVVPASCKVLHIEAEPASDKASVSGTGDIEIGSGINTIEILVRAENGSSKLYTITVARNADAYESYFTTDISYADDFFGGVTPDTTVAELKARLEMKEGYTLNYFNMNAEEKGEEDRVASGDLIQILDSEGNAVYIGTLFIRGDANGDGKISSADLTLIARYIMDEGSLSGAGQMAADANGDGKISSADLTKISKYILDEGDISQ